MRSFAETPPRVNAPPPRYDGRVRILCVSDVVEETMFAAGVRDRHRGVDLILSCGDLPPGYLDYLQTTLNVPLFYVHGNHILEEDSAAARGFDPEGARDLDGRVVRAKGLLVAGFEGCPGYSPGPGRRHLECDVWWRVLKMAPRLVWNALRGRRLDVVVAHAPPRGVHDLPDPCHRGFRALRAFLRLARPRLLVHGHVHLFDRNAPRETAFGPTRVVNACGHVTVDL